MTPLACLFVLLVGKAAADVVDLKCSDNATCIDHMTKEFVRSLRQQKTVRLFDLLTIEPLGRSRQERSNQGPVARFLGNHAFSFDWNDLTFRLQKPEQRSDAVQLEVYDGRSVKDVPETSPKKSTSKVEEDEVQEKRPKRIRRRRNKKVLQALIPMVFGMKSAGTVIFAMAVVTALTIKAFLASKLALLVTVGMALKRLYESYNLGVGLQNHPYLYSQYPIDFPSASSHAYSVSGVSQQFASPELYNPTALATHSHSHEMLQQQPDASAQQSQQAPTLQLANATRASERWDGKNILQKLLEPVINGVKSVFSPIANLFYDAMPVTFRGMTSDVGKAAYLKTDEPTEAASNVVEEKVKKPREFLVPQPRNIAQRKMAEMRKRGMRNRPKKYTELNVDLNKLKRNKDYMDYLRTKKYKYNYHNTYFYPRIKHYINPNNFVVRPITHHMSHRRPTTTRNVTLSRLENKNNKTKVEKDNVTSTTPVAFTNFSDWQPIVVSDELENYPVNLTRRKRTKRDVLKYYSTNLFRNSSVYNPSTGRQWSSPPQQQGRGILGFFDFLFSPDPVKVFVDQADKYAKSVIKHSIKHQGPPKYYLLSYDMVVFGLHVMDDFVKMKTAMFEHIFGKSSKKIKKKKKKPLKCKPKNEEELKGSKPIKCKV